MSDTIHADALSFWKGLLHIHFGTYFQVPTFERLGCTKQLSCCCTIRERTGQNPALSYSKAAALALIFTVSTCIWQVGSRLVSRRLVDYSLNLKVLRLAVLPWACHQPCQCAKETGGSRSPSYTGHPLVLCLHLPFFSSQLFRQMASTLQGKAGWWGELQSLPALWKHTDLSTDVSKGSLPRTLLVPFFLLLTWRSSHWKGSGNKSPLHIHNSHVFFQASSPSCFFLPKDSAFLCYIQPNGSRQGLQPWNCKPGYLVWSKPLKPRCREGEKFPFTAGSLNLRTHMWIIRLDKLDPNWYQAYSMVLAADG